MEYRFTPSPMVCSQEMIFNIENGIIKDLKVIGGCNGNLKGISSLLKDMPIDEAIAKLKGIDCAGRGTSCPDQIAIALEQYKKENMQF